MHFASISNGVLRRSTVAAAIAFGVGLQFWLPMALSALGVIDFRSMEALGVQEIDLWKGRFNLKDPLGGDVLSADEVSIDGAVVRDNQVTLLLHRYLLSEPRSRDQFETVTLDMKTTHMSAETSSDEELRLRLSNRVFRFDGELVAVLGPNSFSTLLQLHSFADGHLQPTQKYVLCPIPHGNRKTEVAVVPEADTLYVIVRPPHASDVYLHKGLLLGSAEEAVAYEQSFAPLDTKQGERELAEAGWQKIEHVFPTAAMGEVLGLTIDNGQLVAIHTSVKQARANAGPFRAADFLGDTRDLLITRFSGAEHSTQSVKLPNPWSLPTHLPFEISRNLFFFRDIDGSVYIASYNRDDQRIEVFALEQNILRMAAGRSTPLRWHLLADIFSFFLCAVVIPTAVLALISASLLVGPDEDDVAHRYRKTPWVVFIRRGCSRVIDQVIVAMPLVLSFVAHVDFVSWFKAMVVHIHSMLELAFDLTRIPNWAGGRQLLQEWLDLLSDLWSAPTLKWLWLLAVLIQMTQIALQAHFGKTLGKWLFGLTVTRRNGAKCGLSASLVRETMLAVDTLLMWCWTPGIISMCLTSRCQRLGDHLAGTIVVADPY